MNNMPKNTLVLTIANTSRPLDSLMEKICVMATTAITNITNASIENNPMAYEIMKNHSENPAVIANALKRGEESSMSYWVNHCDKAALRQYCQTHHNYQ